MELQDQAGQPVELACRCGRHLASIGMRDGGPVNGDRRGVITVRGRSRARRSPGDIVDEGERLRIRCGNPECRHQQIVLECTVLHRADVARRAGRRQVVLGLDL